MRAILIRFRAYLSITSDIEFDEEAITFHTYFILCQIFEIFHTLSSVFNTEINLMVKLFVILCKLR